MIFYGMLVADVAVVISRLWEASAREATLWAHLETVLWPRPYGNEYTAAHRRVKLATLQRNKLRQGPRVGLRLPDGRPAVVGKAFMSGCGCANTWSVATQSPSVGVSACGPVHRQVMVFFLSGGFLEMVGGVRIYRRTIARIRQTQAIDDGRPAADGLGEAAGDAGWAAVASSGVLMNGARSYLDEDNSQLAASFLLRLYMGRNRVLQVH